MWHAETATLGNSGIEFVGIMGAARSDFPEQGAPQRRLRALCEGFIMLLIDAPSGSPG